MPLNVTKKTQSLHRNKHYESIWKSHPNLYDLIIQWSPSYTTTVVSGPNERYDWCNINAYWKGKGIFFPDRLDASFDTKFQRELCMWLRWIHKPSISHNHNNNETDLKVKTRNSNPILILFITNKNLISLHNNIICTYPLNAPKNRRHLNLMKSLQPKLLTIKLKLL